MSVWRMFLVALVFAVLIFFYLDDKRYAEKVRPPGFSTEAPKGSVFAVRLRERLDLKCVHVGQTIRFVPTKSRPYGSATAASLPANAVLEARVKRIFSSPRGRRVIIFEFERLRAAGRTVPLSAFLIVREAAQSDAEQSQRERRGSVGAFIARSAQDDPLTIMAGYLSGTYFGSFWSRQTEAPASFFSNESGQSIPTSVELMIQLHRRTFIPR